MKFKALFAALFASILSISQAWSAATQLPPGEQCFQAVTGINGMVGVLGSITGGSSYTAGTYGGVALTGGSGSGATANITIAGGIVTGVAILNPGIQYVVGDVLSAATVNIGGTGSGFSVPVSSTSINSSLAGGTVTFYQPGTFVFKQTWFNSDQANTHQNTNPVNLDSNGCAIIYGTGIYRQVLKDSLGNTVWDQLTTDVSASNSTFWAGISAGTPNAITVVDPGFNATDGSIISFIPVTSNTGPTTLNPSGFGNISIVKDTTTGAIALSGGEIVANNPSNVVQVIYSASQANFHLLNLVNLSAPQTAQTLCGAIGLKITNDAVTPNTKVVITADQITMITSGAQTISRFNVSLSINFTLNGANGLDTGSLASTTFYNFYVIDNGSSAAALGSVSATAPTMPSGYSYKCRLGAQRTDGATHLVPFLQLGNWSQNNGSVSGLEQLVVGSTAGGATCGSTPITWATITYPAIFPPTATELRLYAVNNLNGNGPANVAAAPNTTYTGLQGTAPPPVFTNSGVTAASYGSWVIEGATFAYCAGANGGALLLLGWKDKVNAN